MGAVRQPPRQTTRPVHSSQREKHRQPSAWPTQPVRLSKCGFTKVHGTFSGASASRQSRRPSCGGPSMSDPSPGCRGLVGRGQSRCSQFVDNACQGFSPDMGCVSRRTFGIKESAESTAFLCDVDICKVEYANVVSSGCTAMFQGTGECMTRN